MTFNQEHQNINIKNSCSYQQILLKEQNEQQLRLLFISSSSSSNTKQKTELISFMIRRLNRNIAASLTATRPNQQRTKPATTEKTLQLVLFHIYSLYFSHVLQPC